jgi:hypothetical protein
MVDPLTEPSNAPMRLTLLRRTAALALAGIITATPTVQAGLLGKIAKLAEKKPVPFDLQTPPEVLAKDYLKIDKLDGLKGLKRVAFPAFQVEFELESNESATSVARQVGEGGGAQSSVSTRYFLKGIDEARCQKITDDLYAAVVAQLQESGLEVVPLDSVKAAPSWSKLPLKPTPFKIDKSKHDSMFCAPQGMQTYFRPGDQRLEFGGISFSALDWNGVCKALATDLDSALIEARFVVTFCDLEGSKQGFWATYGTTATASVKSTLALTFLPGETRFWVLPKETKTSVFKAQNHLALTLKHPVMAGKQLFEVKDITTTGQKLGDAAVTALGVVSSLSGGRNMSSRTKQYEAHVDGAEYAEVTQTYGAAVAKMFVSQLKLSSQ